MKRSAAKFVRRFKGLYSEMFKGTLSSENIHTSLHAGYFFLLLLSSADFFSKLTFSKSSFRDTIRVANGLLPNQDRRSVGPDLCPSCLQRLSADDTSHS